ncbi:MAG: hypothetical protein ACT4TC_11895 [Myxococcaceae bacterium]
MDTLALSRRDALDDERAVIVGMSNKSRLLVTVVIEVNEQPSESSVRVAQQVMRGNAMKKKTSRKVSTKAPSKASLREIPEMDFTTGVVRRNPYGERVAKEGFTIQVIRGRPKKGTETGPTIPRSVRFPASVWKDLERRARAEGIPLHAALRAAVLAWAGGSGNAHR